MEKKQRKTGENLRKSGEHMTGRLEGKDREHCICGYTGKNPTQTQNTMKLEQNSIEMITALSNHPCSKHSAELNQPLRNQDTAFSEANLLLRFARRRVFANGFCVFLRLCSCV